MNKKIVNPIYELPLEKKECPLISISEEISEDSFRRRESESMKVTIKKDSNKSLQDPAGQKETENKTVAENLETKMNKKRPSPIYILPNVDTNITNRNEQKGTIVSRDRNLSPSITPEGFIDLWDLSNREWQNLDAYCNYYPQVLGIVKFLDQNGVVTQEKEAEIYLRVHIAYRSKVVSEDLTITAGQVKDICKIIGAKVLAAQVYAGVKNAQKTIENAVRQQMVNVKTLYCYLKAGWNQVNGVWNYLHRDFESGQIKTCSKLSLPGGCINNQQTIGIWNDMCRIYMEEDTVWTMALYSLSGVLFRLFKEAGYEQHYLLFVTGKTGSMKTSICNVLYTQLARDENRKKPRRIDFDTGVSFEIALVEEGRDTIVLFDDFAPPKTQKAKSTLLDNFELIVRMIGDGSTKSRSSKELDNRRGKGVQGTVVITGELMGTGHSSNLRCLYCHLEKEKVNKEMLTLFQENEYLIGSFIRRFTSYLGNNWDDLKRFIMAEYKYYRSDSQAESMLKSSRLVDCFVTLQITAEILQRFFSEDCKIEHGILEILFKGSKERILSVVAKSEAATEDSDPTFEFMRAFSTLLNTNEIQLSDKRLKKEDLKIYDGFVEGNYVYVLQKNFFTKTCVWLDAIKKPCLLDMREMEKMLCEDGYLIKCPNGPNRYTTCARIKVEGIHGKVYFVKIRRNILESVINGQNPNQ